MKDFPNFPLKEHFLADAADLLAARTKSQYIHSTKDIDAAGDEVEITARDVLARRLPKRCYVTHGHLVDSDLNVSSQIDVVIADALLSPVLFKGQNGSEYVPVESVYAVGEIKSTYDHSKQPIAEFGEKIEKIKKHFRREEVSPSYVQTGGRGLEIEGIPHGNKKVQNPLLSFMLFVNSGDFDVKKLHGIYTSKDISSLPSICCFLDKGVIVFGGFTEKGFGFVKCPEVELNLSPDFEWTYVPYGEQNSLGASCGFLCYSLIAHVQESVLKPPDMQLYLNRMFTFRKDTSVGLGRG